MEILKIKKEIKSKLEKDKLMGAHLIRIGGYGKLFYKCACNQSHNINDRSVKCIASAKPLRALLKCPNDFYTMVKIEGLFKKKITSQYGFESKFMED